MKKNQYFLNTALAIVVLMACAVCRLVRTFLPAAVLPQLDIPNMGALALIALIIDHYVAKGAKRCYICIPVFGALTFGLLPFCAGFATGMEAIKLAVLGGVTFTAVTWLFSAMEDRLSSGPAAKAAPILSAVGLYLALQCLIGIL
jgi:hypothetical protein